MAPPGTKAVIYEDSNTRASWAPHGLDAWLLDPSKDHYQCHIYYVPKTKGYRVSESSDLFPQHCLAPSYLPISHVCELSEELKTNLATLNRSEGTKQVMKYLELHVRAFILNEPLPDIVPKQRVTAGEQRVVNNHTNESNKESERRVTTPLAKKPTAPRVLQVTSQTHQRCTQRNTSGALPKIVKSRLITPLDDPAIAIKPTQKCVRDRVTRLLTPTTP
jgi:hypothetical protein